MSGSLKATSGPKWLLSKFHATVVDDIWPEVLFFTLFATMVTLVSKMTSTSLGISNQMLTVLGTVLGLVISFRTSTAYERFMEGRKLWTNIAIASRNLAQGIWIYVPFDQTKDNKSQFEVILEKKSMINLVQAFSVSVKHLLRGEGGVYYKDLYPLVSFLPRYINPDPIAEDHMLPLWKASGMDHEAHDTLRRSYTSRFRTNDMDKDPDDLLDEKRSVDEKSASIPNEAQTGRHPSSRRSSDDPESPLANIPSEHPLRPAHDPPRASLIDIVKSFARRLRGKRAKGRHTTLTGKKLRPHTADSNVPLQITLYLSNYTATLIKQNYLHVASANILVNSISSLQDSVTNLERIRETPLPFAYQVHLRTSLWLFLLFLPFQTFTLFGYVTIPATAFASYLTLGFLEIGQEIENPFDYYENDLDLDHFCRCLQREMHEITAHPAPGTGEFLFTKWNYPFAPGDSRDAEQMMNEVDHPYHDAAKGMDNIRRTMLKTWRDVDRMTRQ